MQPSPERRGDAGIPARPLKLLIVTDEMEVGGSQRQIVNLALGLDPRRFAVTVAYFRERSFFVDLLRSRGIRVVQIPKAGKVDARFVATLRRELREGGYDLVHAFAFSAELWTAIARLGLRGTRRPRLITSIRGTYDWYSSLQWQLKRWVTAQSSRVVANSRMGADYARGRLGRVPAPIDVVYNGVAEEPARADAHTRLRAEWGCAADDFVVLFAGRLIELKDVPTLLRAAARLHAQGRPLALVIAGDGPQREALQVQAREAGLAGTVRFLGARDDVADCIEACDVLVLPSRQEGLSNVILEALRGQRCVVASRAGGNGELIDDGRNGLLFEVGDDRGLADALARLRADAALRHGLAQAGRQKLQRQFGVTTMVERLADLYADVCGTPASRVAA